jgi:uncharacterized RDD family membrane protein YckC
VARIRRAGIRKTGQSLQFPAKSRRPSINICEAPGANKFAEVNSGDGFPLKRTGRAGRDTEALRQSAQKIDEPNSWKLEVTRRVAEHRERRVPAGNEAQMPGDGRHAASVRAAEAAARVAARYAQAPSYSEMLAEEARAAVRAAEAASKAALEAQAAAESVLAGLEAAVAPAPAWEEDFFTPVAPEPVRTPAAAPARKSAPARLEMPAVQESLQTSPRPSFEIRFDADLPVRETVPTAARESHGASVSEATQGDAREAAPDVRNLLGTDGVQVVEPALPIHANLIEFPRELVATRKIRPRRAEGPYAAELEAQGQLSIFEVEPWTISTEPAATGAAAEAGAAHWAEPKWSGIELEAETPAETASSAAAPARVLIEEPVAADAELRLAPMNRRIMAGLVDFSLISGAFLAAAVLAAVNVRVLPGMKEIELGSMAALALIGVFYLAVFFILGQGTPGMKYARLEMCTFAGRPATRAQRCLRMGMIVLSFTPMGMGAVMAIFDEQNLAWHDKWSGTYLRRKQ